jgi:hypothetical protein
VQTPNPPVGASISYYVSSKADGNLAIQIADGTGTRVRRIDGISKDPGIHRLTWNLRPDPAAGAAGAGGGGRGGGGRGGGGAAGPAGAAGAGAPAGATGVAGAAAPPGAPIDPAAVAAFQGGGGGGGGRGGGGGAMVPAGSYTATLVKVDGDKVTPVGKPQTFQVVPLPAKNW